MSYAQSKQDLFVLEVLKNKRNGYFVEFGATDGIHISNTYILEKDYGWDGIVAEAAKSWHEDLVNNRNCHVDLRCVWKETGSTIMFNETDNRDLSTIDEFSNNDYWAETRKSGTKYPVETVSLNDLLATYEAPTEIDFISLDTEGSEYEILKAFDFDKYKVKIILCEHNGSENKQLISDFMASKGYEIHPLPHLTGEDFFILKELDVEKPLFHNYVISLKRTPERLEKFLKDNEHMQFQVFEAIDGNDIEPFGGYTKYAHAVALSHIELWKKCAEGTEDFLICEDDAELHKDLQRALDGLNAANHPYDFIGWGWNFDAELFVGILPELSPVSMHFSQEHMRQNKQNYLATPIDPVLMRLYYYFGCCCYTISPAGAKRFLEILYPLQKQITVDIKGVKKFSFEARGIDCVMAQAFVDTLSVVCFPPMALSQNDHSKSTIQNQK